MSALQQSNSFSAHLALAAGVAVSITAPTLDDLSKVVAKLQPAANDEKPPADKPASTSKPPAATKPETATKPEAEKPKAAEGNASASTPPAAGAQAAGAGSADAGGEKRPTYDDVRDRVLKLAKVSRDTATAALAKFNVDHGNKLKLEDYPAFLKHADEVLAGAKA